MAKLKNRKELEKKWPKDLLDFIEREIPSSMQNVYLKAMRGRSKASGVKAFCQQCGGYQIKPVENCCCKICPLRPYRPYKPEDEPKDQRKRKKE